MTVYGRRPGACSLLLLGVLALAGLGLLAPLARSARAAHEGRAVRGRHAARGGHPLPPRAVASIVGGASTSIARFPFQVALYNPHAGSPAAGFFCGGVIIDATHVVTAAHCIDAGARGRVGPLDEIEVLAGSTNLSPTDPGSVRDPLTGESFDSSYNPVTNNLDVALLTLARPLWSGPPPSIDGVNKIAPLPVEREQAAVSTELQAGQPVVATVSGWGDVDPAPTDGPGYPNALQSVRVPLVSEALCGEDYAGIEQTITPSMLCAGGSRPRTDSCYGDSGGPLVVDRDTPAEPPGDYVLAGLVDFGNGCAQPGYPGVYTRIASPEVVNFLAAGLGHKARLAAKQSRKKRRRRGRPHPHH
ncbi:MAG: serine protease [Solirubrobacteraceae bacterium]